MYNSFWYDLLIKPPLTPPAWIFAPVWAILYIMIFVAFAIYAIKPYSGNKSWGYIVFFIQMLLNLCWSPVFFYFHNIGMALAVIIIMDVFVILNIIEFFKVSKTAGLLLIPYFLWILFATYLNFGFFIQN